MASLATGVEAQQYTATMILDPLPSTIVAGNTVTFSGTLMTSDGQYVIPGKTVYIKDDIPFAPDTFIATVVTGNNGKFSATWTAVAKEGGDAYNFYAVFEGDNQVGHARSVEYTVSVTQGTSSQGSSASSGSGGNYGGYSSWDQYCKATYGSNYQYDPSTNKCVQSASSSGGNTGSGGSSGSPGTATYYYTSLVLDSIPSVVNEGDTVTFSGSLMTQDGKYAISSATISIKDDIAFAPDVTIGTLVTDSNGKFYGTWKAVPKSGNGQYHFYATYDGNSQIQSARSLEYTVTVISQSIQNTPGSSSSSSASANRFSTEITLDPIPSTVYAENDILFSGKLTSNGQALSNALIYIKKDIPALPDEVLAYGNTDSNGQFSIRWAAQLGEILKTFGVYAIFEGGGNYAQVRSNDQYLTVQKYVPQITLNQFPTSANVGDVITFSGSLQLPGANLEGDVVYIKDDVELAPDILLATAYVDSTGHYSTSWVVSNLHRNGLAHIYAVFEGDQAHSRVTTCDIGPTSSFGGSCFNTIVLRITQTNLPPTPPPPPPQQPPAQLPPSTEKLNGNEYIKLYYSLPLDENPVVAISPTPDSYDQVQGYINPIEDGIKMWTNDLQNKYGGNWNVNFEVLGKNLPHFDKKPDMIINIVTQDQEVGCDQEFGGVTYFLFPNPVKPINIEVCANNYGQFNPNWIVSSYAAHEFIHAMGLGHAFNKEGDLMCSYEYVSGVLTNTCPNLNNKSPYPSDFDLAGVAQIYGTDGFLPPNNQIAFGSELTANQYTSLQYGTVNHPSTSQNQGTTSQSIVIPQWVRNNALWWSEGKMSDSDFIAGIQYLVKQGIIILPQYQSTGSQQSATSIPSWIKTDAKLWATGYITDQDFVRGIQYMIFVGYIHIGS